MNGWREDFAELSANGKEPVLRAISADAIAELEEWPVLPASVVSDLSNGRVIDA